MLSAPGEDIKLFYCEKLKRAYISERVNITIRFDKEPELDEHVKRYVSQLDSKMQEVIAFTKTPLDGRFTRVRSEETAVGNMYADLVRT